MAVLKVLLGKTASISSRALAAQIYRCRLRGCPSPDADLRYYACAIVLTVCTSVYFVTVTMPHKNFTFYTLIYTLNPVLPVHCFLLFTFLYLSMILCYLLTLLRVRSLDALQARVSKIGWKAVRHKILCKPGRAFIWDDSCIPILRASLSLQIPA
jgi:hypothetical protein